LQTLGPLRSETVFGRLRIRLFGANSRERFSAETISTFGWIIRDHNGKVLSNGEGYPSGFDAAVVEFETNKVKLRIIRFRGEFRADITAITARNSENWEDVDCALQALNPEHKPSLKTLQELSGLIQKNWPALERVTVRT
jgi:hypothetical protein